MIQEAGSFLRAFFPPLVYYEQETCSLWDNIPIVPDTKHPFQHTGVIYIKAFVCVRGQIWLKALYGNCVLLPG